MYSTVDSGLTITFLLLVAAVARIYTVTGVYPPVMTRVAAVAPPKSHNLIHHGTAVRMKGLKFEQQHFGVA